MLRMPKTIPYNQKVKKVDEVLMELSLVKCKNTKIGQPGHIKGELRNDNNNYSNNFLFLTPPLRSFGRRKKKISIR